VGFLPPLFVLIAFQVGKQPLNDEIWIVFKEEYMKKKLASWLLENILLWIKRDRPVTNSFLTMKVWEIPGAERPENDWCGWNSVSSVLSQHPESFKNVSILPQFIRSWKIFFNNPTWKC